MLLQKSCVLRVSHVVEAAKAPRFAKETSTPPKQLIPYQTDKNRSAVLVAATCHKAKSR